MEDNEASEADKHVSVRSNPVMHSLCFQHSEVLFGPCEVCEEAWHLPTEQQYCIWGTTAPPQVSLVRSLSDIIQYAQQWMSLSGTCYVLLISYRTPTVLLRTTDLIQNTQSIVKLTPYSWQYMSATAPNAICKNCYKVSVMWLLIPSHFYWSYFWTNLFFSGITFYLEFVHHSEP
jgi:hypothetical protein